LLLVFTIISLTEAICSCFVSPDKTILSCLFGEKEYSFKITGCIRFIGSGENILEIVLPAAINRWIFKREFYSST